jgi:hypothetical protein
MKLRRIPIGNPIGLGIVAGAIILASFPKVRKKIRECAVKGVSSTIGFTRKFYDKDAQENLRENSYDFSKPLKEEVEDSLEVTQGVENPISENAKESSAMKEEEKKEVNLGD